MTRDTITAELVMNPAIDLLFALYLGQGKDASVPAGQVCDATGAEGRRRWESALAERGLGRIDEDGCRLADQGAVTVDRVDERMWQITARHISIDIRPIDHD